MDGVLIRVRAVHHGLIAPHLAIKIDHEPRPHPRKHSKSAYFMNTMHEREEVSKLIKLACHFVMHCMYDTT